MAGGLAERQAGDKRLTHADVLAIALPITLSNVTTPLVGFVDTLVIGRLGEAYLIGAVAVAANIFSLIYWAFGFLRMGTTGLTAQAVGACDAKEIAANLMRPVVIAVVAGLALIALQYPILEIALWSVGASTDVDAHARVYFTIRIWSAPAALINYVIVGWLIGQAKASTAFWLQLVLNVINLVLSVLFVLWLGAGVAGVAWAAVIAEVVAAAAGLVVVYYALQQVGGVASLQRTFNVRKLRKLLAVNADILVRTLCLLIVFFFFMAQGARMGDVTLAANAILHAMALLTVYFLDGFAVAAETLVGHAVGARDRVRFGRVLKLSTVWAGTTAVVMSLVLWFGGPALIEFMTTSEAVRVAAGQYLIWAALTPIIGVWCFQLDGVFIGATRSADMRNMMLLSSAVFFALWWVLMSAYGNHGLWLAVMGFYVVRAFALGARLPSLQRAAFDDTPSTLNQK